MGSLGGGSSGGTGSGSSYQSEAHATLTAGIGPVTFGDNNVGSGAGNGLKFNAVTYGIIGAVLIAIVFIFKRAH